MTQSSSGRWVMRIFLDKGHVYLSGHQARDWNKLSKFLSIQNTQRILVTATLSLRLEMLLVEDKLQMGSWDQVHLIRDPTLRPELSHNVISFSRGTTRNITIRASKTLQPLLLGHERMIIFVMSADVADHLAAALECSKYHSGETNPATSKKRDGM